MKKRHSRQPEVIGRVTNGELKPKMEVFLAYELVLHKCKATRTHGWLSSIDNTEPYSYPIKRYHFFTVERPAPIPSCSFLSSYYKKVNGDEVG